MSEHQVTEWLRTLEFAQVAVTATIDPAGRLGAVGGLWPKLLAASKEAAQVGLLRVIVVAANQADITPELLTTEATPLRVLQAATLQEAISKLYEEHGPRETVRKYERQQCASLDFLGRSAPLETHYQVLPLLREIRRERLPRGVEQAPGAQALTGNEAASNPLAETDLLRWEEELREERVTYEVASLTDIFHRFRSLADNVASETPRFVVVGPPGSGKSSLIQYLSWQAARGAVQIAGRTLLPARVRLRDWEAWATREGALESGLPAYLATQYQSLSPAPSATQWRQWLQRGEALLFLDGLDEIEGKPVFLSAVKTALTTFPLCAIVLTCRTVSFEQHRALCPDFPLFTLAGLNTAQRNAFIRAFPAAPQGEYAPELLIEQLDRTPQLLSLAANPLLLSLICHAMENARDVRLPSTRGALYAKVLEKLLLTRSRRIEVRYPGEEPSVDEKLAILQRATFRLFMQDAHHRPTFTGQALGHALQQALHEEGYGTRAAPWANALRADLTQNSGLLRRNADHEFFFLHLTIQEFLVARALAQVVNLQGWQATLEIAGQQVSVHRVIDVKAWDPHWQEVLLLLAGQLKDPTKLLRLLMDRKKDDLFGNRFALAAQCLMEVSPSAQSSFSSLTDRLTTGAITLWLQHFRAGTVAAIPHLTRALPALGYHNGRFAGEPLFQWLQRRLRHASSEVRAEAAEVLGYIGDIMAQDQEILSTLLVGVRDPESVVRMESIEALRRLGGVVAQNSEALAVLVHAAQHDSEGAVRLSAVRALRQMGAAVPQPPETDVFLTSLSDEEIQRRSVAAAPNGCSTKAAPAQSSSSTSLLTATVRDGDTHTRAQAARRLGQLDDARNPEVLTALLEAALYDKDAGVRAQAINALGQMGGAILQQPETLPALVATLHDRDGGVRARSAQALGRLGAATLRHPEAFAALIVACHDANSHVRYRAAAAIAQLMAQGVRLFRRWWGKIEGKHVEDLAKV